MSSLNEQITSFLESVGEDNDILHFLYNLNNKKFDRKNQSIYYSGPFWDNKEAIAIIETLLSGKWRDRNLLLAEVRDYTISGPRNPAVVCFTSLLSSLTAISSPHPFCFLSTTHNLP